MKRALIITMVVGIMALGYNNYTQCMQIRQLQDVMCTVSKVQSDRIGGVEDGLIKFGIDTQAALADLDGAITKLSVENDTAHGELAASVINTAVETALVNAQQQQVIEQIVAEMLAIYNRNHSNIMEWR